MPAMLTNPRVGNTPTTALVDEGMRIEFPVSVPVPNIASFEVTAVTVPPDEPPGLKRTSYALPVRPKAVLRLVSLAAKSGIFVCPKIIAPAARSLATTVASFGAINSWPGILYPCQPSVVIKPFTQVFALITTGTPHKGPRWYALPPVAAALSSSAAACSAFARSSVCISL